MSSLSRETQNTLVSEADRSARAISELRRGAPIVLLSAHEAILVAAAEMIEPVRLRTLREIGRGPGVLAITAARAATLKARSYDGDLARIILREDQDAATLRAIADPALDLAHPLLGPHETERAGETELHRAALKLCKLALLLPAATLWRLPDRATATALAAQYELMAFEPTVLEKDAAWRQVVAAALPIAVAENARLHIFRRGLWEDEHYALEIGEPDRAAPVLTRLHSACVTGDLFGSLKCDCGPQLQAALTAIGAAGGGVLVYLLQEGRGIGLANKLRAYRLQDQGFDTVEANHRLGFEDDERLLRDGGDILRMLGFRSARVMTNNPNKLQALSQAGIEVIERVPLIIPSNPKNEAYLRVKASKSGHLL